MRYKSLSAGFALPTIVISSVVLFAVLAAVTGMAASSTSALTQQYYESLAADAAESGATHVEECMATNGGVATWTASNNLTPASKCDGTAASGASLYLINKPTYRTTYTVEPAVTTSTGSITIKVTGKTELIRQSNSQVWKTYTKTTVMRRTYDADGWSKQVAVTANLKSSDDLAYSAFGGNIAIDGDTLVVSSSGTHVDATGAVYVFKNNGSAWVQQAKLESGVSSDSFGASISIDGDTIAVGAWRDNTKAGFAGAVYIYQRSGNDWLQQAKLTASDGAFSDYFGISVALEGDVLVAGAYCDDGAAENTGSAYIYERSGTTWTQKVKLAPSDLTGAFAQFGQAVSMSRNTIAVGAEGDNVKGAYSGSVYVYKRQGNAWPLQTKLTAADGAAYDYFGGAVDINGDTLAVGAREDDDDATNAGSVYVFSQKNGAWTQMSKLVTGDGVENVLLGGVITIRDDEDSMAVYAAGDTMPYLSKPPSAVYIWDRAGDNWMQRTKIINPNQPSKSGFGRGLTWSGNTLVVGSKGELTSSGRLYVLSPVDQSWF